MADVVRWRPRRYMPAVRYMPNTRDELESALDWMLRDWMTRTEYPTYTGYEWYPTIDVSESDKDFQVRAEIPGVDPKDVDISVDENHNLIIAGEKRQEEEKEGRDWYRVERSYGTFRRSISLPVETDTTKVRATSRDGVITITVPKDGERKRRKVEIQTT